MIDKEINKKMKILRLTKPENCCTVWELQRDYNINKQKTCRAIRSGKLNGFMLGIDSLMLCKWYIERDELLEIFIKQDKDLKEITKLKRDEKLKKDKSLKKTSNRKKIK